MENEDREFKLNVLPAPERLDRDTAIAWLHDEAAGYLEVVTMGLLAEEREIRTAMTWLVADLRQMVQACSEAIREDRAVDVREPSVREMIYSGSFEDQALLLAAQVYRENYNKLGDCVMATLARAIACRLREAEKLIPPEAA